MVHSIKGGRHIKRIVYAELANQSARFALVVITQLKQSALSDWLIRHILFAHGCMLRTYSLTKAKRALCDVAQLIEDLLGCASRVHNILTTGMTRIVADKSTDNAKPHSICFFFFTTISKLWK